MRKFIIGSLMLASATLFANDADLINKLNSDKIQIAQNAAQDIEKAKGGEAIMLEAIESEDNKLLKDAMVQSLATLKSKKGYAKILNIAKTGDTAAILALAKYGDDAVSDLKSIASKNPEMVMRAIVLASSKYPKPTVPSLEEFNAGDENAQTYMLYSLPCDESSLKLLNKIDPTSIRMRLALLGAYSRAGGAEAAQKIFDLQKKFAMNINAPMVQDRIANCKDADEVILKEIKAGNKYAIRAAKVKKIGSAEEPLLALLNSSDNSIVKDTIDALSEVGSEKSLNILIQKMTTAKTDLPLYVRVCTALYWGSDKATKDKYAKIIKENIAVAKGSNKVALERVITKPKAPAK